MQTGTTLAITIFFTIMTTMFSRSSMTNKNDRLLKMWLTISFLCGTATTIMAWLLTVAVNSADLTESDSGVHTMWLILVIGVGIQISTFFTGYFLDMVDSNKRCAYANNINLDVDCTNDLTKKRIIISCTLAILNFIVLMIGGVSIVSLATV